MHHSNQEPCSLVGFSEYLDNLLPPVVPYAFAVAMLILLSSSNFWWSNDRVLAHLQVSRPDIVRIVSSNRHAWSASEFTVECTDGTRDTYILDTDMRQHAYFWRR